MPSKKANTSIEDLGIIGPMNSRFPHPPEEQRLPCVLIPDRQPGGFGVSLLPPDESTPIPLPIQDTDAQAVWDSVCRLIIDFEQSAPRSTPPWLRPTKVFLEALGHQPS
ncbi:MAG TPA: hypothetical protein DEQ73_05140 [Phycisphaerales bacterium]|nr:hypothetical protein [Phycisphaerales bacterium]